MCNHEYGKEGEELLVVGALQVKDEDTVFLMSGAGQALMIRMADLSVMGRSTQGVRLVSLKEGKLVGMQKIESIDSIEKDETE